MKFLRIKDYVDDIYVRREPKKKSDYVTLVKNELLTESEIRRNINEAIANRLLSNDLAEWVNIPLSKTHWFFGCRFEAKEHNNE